MSSNQTAAASLGSGAYTASKRSARNVLPARSAATTSTVTDGLTFKGSGAAASQASTTTRPSYPDGATANGTSHYHHSSGVEDNVNTANGSKDEPKSNTDSSTSGSAAATTESVIEELKALAKSMLEATNAARRRTSSIEQRNSYEALMHAIENRVNADASTTTSNEDRDATAFTGGYTGAPTTVATAPKHVDPISPNCVSQLERLSGHLMEQLTDIPAALSPGSGVKQQSQQLPPTQLKKFGKEELAAGAVKTDATVRGKQEPAVSSQQKQHQQRQRADVKHHAEVEEVGAEEENEEGPDEGNSAQVQSLAVLRSQPPIMRRRTPTTALEADEDEEDDDGAAYDGVKTQVLFKPVNRAAYREVVASTWKPEGLTRRISATGSGGRQHHNSNRSRSASELKDSPRHPNSGDDDDEAIMTVATRNKADRTAGQKAVSMKVYRVPSFPYGGGVTEKQARLLQRLFDECIHNGEHLSSNATGPVLITKRDFDSCRYDEVPVASAQRDMTSFQPRSPYEFVVEVERDVRFDAVKSREERRHRFRQLVRENRAPATMGTFNLRVIMDPFKTGFEEEKNFPIVPGTVIAGRYEIIQMLGKATFSRAVRCYDLQDPIYDDEEDDGEEYESDADGDDEHGASALPTDKAEDAACTDKTGVTTSSCKELDAATTTNTSKRHRKADPTVTTSRLECERKRKILGYGQVCLKIINNTKDFFDQSLDEIRLLTLLNRQKDPDDAHIVRLIDAFYYKEHIMLVTELLRETLYDYGKYNREEEEEFYFTVPRLRLLTRQIVEALTYVHSLNLIHTDLKPENIMFVSYSRCIVKVIDFGSSCFLSDHLSSYIQSRSYRAPEVVLGCDYDGRIDVWSLGAILVEMVTGDVLFTSDTVPEMLARIVYVCGTPFPRRMLWEGRHTSDYINKFGCIYEYGGCSDGQRDHPEKGDTDDGEEPYCLYTPLPTMAPHTCASPRKSRAAATPLPPRTETAPYSVLREKLAAANMVDPEFIAFVEACLMLDHKKRPTSAELLEHPFIRDVKV
ncbi:Protein tyrosine kinase/Protein kinase domain containing protein, putative [Leishmania shawi]|uniref:Protein kinase domain-containing protein n=1 Tax=Leishmania shawi TaxID=5680 RepID=A0ABR3EBL8_9TRYP